MNGYKFSWNKWKIEDSDKEIEVIKKNQLEMIELKDTITEI